MYHLFWGKVFKEKEIVFLKERFAQKLLSKQCDWIFFWFFGKWNFGKSKNHESWKYKNSPSEIMPDHCVKFCRRVTHVSMSSSLSWQRNFNKTLNSCIIPEEKVKTPSLRCKYMYVIVHTTSIHCKSSLKPVFFFLVVLK